MTATALVEGCYERIASEDRKIGAFLTLSKERALAKADEVDRRAKAGDEMPALAGVSVAIKDVLVTQGVRTTAGSKILGNYVPPYDATVVKRLEVAGGGVLGKTKYDECAVGASNEKTARKPVAKPHAIGRVSRRVSGGRRA